MGAAPIDVKKLAAALGAGDRRALARAITLVESTREDHRAQAEELLAAILPAAGNSVRLGISDGKFTEVLSGDIKDRDPLVVGAAETPTDQSQSTLRMRPF